MAHLSHLCQKTLQMQEIGADLFVYNSAPLASAFLRIYFYLLLLFHTEQFFTTLDSIGCFCQWKQSIESGSLLIPSLFVSVFSKFSILNKWVAVNEFPQESLNF